MPRIPAACRSKTFLDAASITPTPYLDFLFPNVPATVRGVEAYKRARPASAHRAESRRLESFFFSVLSQAALCQAHRAQGDLRDQTHLASRNPSISSSNIVRPMKWYPKRLHPGSAVSLRQFSTDAISEGQSGGRWRRVGSGIERKKSAARVGHLQQAEFFQPNFAAGSRLPRDFYQDVDDLQATVYSTHITGSDERESGHRETSDSLEINLEGQIGLLKSVRLLEGKLSAAKAALRQSLNRAKGAAQGPRSPGAQDASPVTLTKEDYLGLVDLYFYSHQSRFEPDSPDHSPTPLFLEDYSFKLSADLRRPGTEEVEEDDRDEDISPLKHVEEMLKSRQLREISVMQAFIDLLLDNNSSNRALFEVYQRFPDPGVASLPRGVIRLFLQRMSTPWVKSEKTMLRYLSLIDDMQRASLPITSAEWSSAIYLAGRSFARVTENEVATSFRIWREMEHGAGVKANHVTFNILFDIAVRAGKYALGQTILKEMHDRGLRLNRLGRVSLIYYHGLRGDGDGVRKAYRDFVEAGEIVDTLVLNCVMASLINAQEPVAAEQVYERMKNLQSRLHKGTREDGEEALFMRYPPPGSNMIDTEMASNSLGRVLLNARRLRDILPEHHVAIQNSMPLTPDEITFRTMIAHHASTSGDLDRLTVLMQDMTEQFDLPFTSLTFQLLFKGFAIHGGSRSDTAKWTLNRLDLVWAACREAIQLTRVHAETLDHETDANPSLPTVAEVDMETAAQLQAQALLPPKTKKRGPKKLGAWNEFVIDLAIYPRERLKPVHERKAPRTLQEGEENPFATPFFPQDEGDADATTTLSSSRDDGDEYSLPSAENYSGQRLPAEPDLESESPSPQHRVRATRALVIWLLRAYQRVTGSRREVEDVWFQVRKVWKPADTAEKDAIVRVLQRALRDCDRLGGG